MYLLPGVQRRWRPGQDIGVRSSRVQLLLEVVRADTRHGGKVALKLLELVSSEQFKEDDVAVARDAEDWLESGKVRCDGQLAALLGHRIHNATVVDLRD